MLLYTQEKMLETRREKHHFEDRRGGPEISHLASGLRPRLDLQQRHGQPRLGRRASAIDARGTAGQSFLSRRRQACTTSRPTCRPSSSMTRPPAVVAQHGLPGSFLHITSTHPKEPVSHDKAARPPRMSGPPSRQYAQPRMACIRLGASWHATVQVVVRRVE